MDPTTALQAVQSWSKEDQLNFAFEVWDQIVEGGWTPELTDDLKAELDRRLKSYKANPTNVVSWEQIVSHVRRER